MLKYRSLEPIPRGSDPEVLECLKHLNLRSSSDPSICITVVPLMLPAHRPRFRNHCSCSLQLPHYLPVDTDHLQHWHRTPRFSYSFRGPKSEIISTGGGRPRTQRRLSFLTCSRSKLCFSDSLCSEFFPVFICSHATLCFTWPSFSDLLSQSLVCVSGAVL